MSANTQIQTNTHQVPMHFHVLDVEHMGENDLGKQIYKIDVEFEPGRQVPFTATSGSLKLALEHIEVVALQLKDMKLGRKEFEKFFNKKAFYRITNDHDKKDPSNKLSQITFYKPNHTRNDIELAFGQKGVGKATRTLDDATLREIDRTSGKLMKQLENEKKIKKHKKKKKDDADETTT